MVLGFIYLHSALIYQYLWFAATFTLYENHYEKHYNIATTIGPPIAFVTDAPVGVLVLTPVASRLLPHLSPSPSLPLLCAQQHRIDLRY